MRMRRHNSSQSEEGAHGIDLAPMLDFVMNLLIFFIITAVFVKEVGITVSRPNASNAEKKEGGSIIVAINAAGEIIIDKRTVDVRAIRASIERLHAQRPEDGVVVIADKNAQTGILVTVLDQVRLGGVQNVSIAASQA